MNYDQLHFPRKYFNVVPTVIVTKSNMYRTVYQSLLRFARSFSYSWGGGFWKVHGGSSPVMYVRVLTIENPIGHVNTVCGQR